MIRSVRLADADVQRHGVLSECNLETAPVERYKELRGVETGDVEDFADRDHHSAIVAWAEKKPVGAVDAEGELVQWYRMSR